MLREAASTEQRLLVAREAARGDHREGVPDGDMQDDFEPVAGGSSGVQDSGSSPEGGRAVRAVLIAVSAWRHD